MNLTDFLADNQLLLRIVISAVLVIAVSVLRGATIRLVRGGHDVLDAQKRRQLFYTRSAFNLVLALGLLMIWLGQVQNLVLSLTAVMVAVVLATKELLMCVSGFALRTGASSFSVGDWIQVGELRGEVADFDLLSTTILELDPPHKAFTYTGNRIVVPNSLFLTAPVRNLKLSRHFMLHEFTITAAAEVDTRAALDWLEKATKACFEEFAEEARRRSAATDQLLGADLPGPEPRVTLSTSDGGHPRFGVLLYCPTRRATALEHRLTAGLLDFVRAGAGSTRHGAG